MSLRAALPFAILLLSACTRGEPSAEPPPATPATPPTPAETATPTEHPIVKAPEDDGAIPSDVAQALAKRYPGPPDGMCSPPVVCGELVKIDCGAAVDGPLHYLRRKTGDEVSLCGGACMHPMGKQVEVCKTMCPPPAWTCD